MRTKTWLVLAMAIIAFLFFSACAATQFRRPSVQGYPVIVDYNQTLDEMVEAGDYDSIDYCITPRIFALSESSVIFGNNTRVLYLIHFDKFVTTDNVLVALDKAGLRPANIEELLAFGATYSKIQQHFPIVALGSPSLRQSGTSGIYRIVPTLCGNERIAPQRFLNVDDYGVGIDGRWWRADYRFLAVSK